MYIYSAFSRTRARNSKLFVTLLLFVFKLFARDLHISKIMIRGSASKTKKKSQQKNTKENIDKKLNTGSAAVININKKGKNVHNMSSKGEVLRKNDDIREKRQLSPIQSRVVAEPHTLPDPPKKMERSHSFFLSRKLSKIYNNITGSKESLTKIPENDEPPGGFKFTRSITMASIPLRKSFRRVFGESKLEKLHEEHIPERLEKEEGNTIDPKIVVAPVSKVQLRRSSSTLCPEDLSSFRERSSSFLSSLRRTFSNSGSPEKVTKSLNPKWSASLANLQHIDVMVSYEDLSFINYDKFNTYEKQLKKQQSTGSKRLSVDDRMLSDTFQMEYKEFPPPSPTIVEKTAQNSSPAVVRYRRPSNSKISQELSTNFDANFDQPRNLYRQSLDDRKLQFLNKVNRDSFRLSNYLDRNAQDVFMLDNYNLMDTNIEAPEDCVDGNIDTATAGQLVSESVSSNSVNFDKKCLTESKYVSMMDISCDRAGAGQMEADPVSTNLK